MGETFLKRRPRIIAIIAFLVLIPSASATTYTVCSSGCDFTAIQGAVDAASDGNTIIVKDGTYVENVDVNKSLTIRSENGADSTSVRANNSKDHVFEVTADYVNISGFTVRGAIERDKAGIYLHFADYCDISNNNASNNYDGIYLGSSSSNRISNNSMNSNKHDGIYLLNSWNNTIRDNNISNYSTGIYLYGGYSNNNTVRSNILKKNGYGIVLYKGPSNNTITNNIISDNGRGINLNRVLNNTISNNIFRNDGLFIYSSYHNTVENNTVNGNPLIYLEDISDYTIDADAGQVILVNSTNITVENLDLSNVTVGIKLLKTRNSKIMNNNISSTNYPLKLHWSSNNDIRNNILSNNGRGISLWMGSSNNRITNNTITNASGTIISLGYSSTNIISNNDISGNSSFRGISLFYSLSNNITNNDIKSTNRRRLGYGYGITLTGSPTNLISHNVISNTAEGITLRDSSNRNVLRNNNFENTGLLIYNRFKSSYDNIVEGNIVNNRPILYFEDVADLTIREIDAGQVIIVNSKNITVENLNLTDTNAVGIHLLKTENSNIANNLISNLGLARWASQNGRIFVSEVPGIYLEGSSTNTVTNNDISTFGTGIKLESSKNNTIIRNNVRDNYHRTGGIYLKWSSNNSIYHNNFIDNRDRYQAYVYGGSGNIFDNGYPSGGNYWSDYTEIDLYSGPNQDGPGSDGIGDTSYTFTGGQDNYPFINQTGWETCFDSIMNQDETDVDCGGSCSSCANEKTCIKNSDCVSNYCNPDDICSIPSCNDGWKNQDETDVDCGGSCPLCTNEKFCLIDTDCLSNYCNPNKICSIPSCNDGLKNGNETGIDCGGNCPKCPSPEESLIIFSSYRDGNWEIYSMKTDGGEQIDLSNNSDFDADPGASADGSKIVFSSDRDCTYTTGIFIMDSDGANITRITGTTTAPDGSPFCEPVIHRHPKFSPDGSKVVFTGSLVPGGPSTNKEIYIMNVNGTNFVDLTNNSADDFHPVFTPDGKKIVFVSTREGNNEIYIMNLDGTNQTRLTFNSTDDDVPDLSPDGSKITFTTKRDGNYEIYVMDIDGTNLVRLTNNSADDGDSEFSLDGSKITFVSNRDGNLEVYIMNLDGTNQTRLTYTSADEFQPTFLNYEMEGSPDNQPPGTITDLAIREATANSITQTWTAPGDDGNTGTASSYDIRYSTSPITEVNWDSATQAAGEPTPQPAGSSESFIVTGIISGTTYYFALKTADEVPNWSGLSNVVSGTTTLPPQCNPSTFPELFTYGTQTNDNIYNAFYSISQEFAKKNIIITPELLAAVMATLKKEVEVGSFLPVEENGDFGMGPGCTYPIDIDGDGIKECRGTPYDGDVPEDGAGGVDYKGRGYIQITHKYNYQKHCGAECIGTSAPELDVCGCKNQWYCTVTDENICPQVKALQFVHAGKIFASYYQNEAYYKEGDPDHGKNLVTLSNEKGYWKVGKRINGGDNYANDFEIKADDYFTLFDTHKTKTENFITCLSDSFSNQPPIAKPVITSLLEISPIKDTYYVGDTLTATFTITNKGTAPITFDNLTVGGRLNGWCPTEGCPDFTHRSLTLQSGGSYNYEGSFTPTQSGNHHFFIAYYIENPTPEEKRLLDENNWNTSIDLGEGLTHADRIKNIIVLVEESPSPDTVSELRDRINDEFQRDLEYRYPPNLRDPDSFKSAVASVWAGFTSWATQTHLTEKYDELYQTGIDYDSLRFKALINARDSLDRNDIVSAKKYLQKSYTYGMLSAMSFGAAAEVYDNNLAAGEILAEGVKNGAESSVGIGLAVTNPAAAKAADYIYLGVDYAVDRALVGEEQAAKNAIVKIAVTTIFNEIPLKDLGDKTIGEYTENRLGKVTFPMLQKVFQNNEQRQFIASKIIKEIGVEIEEDAAEELVSSILDELGNVINLKQSEVKSPVELQVYDSQGKAAGLLNGTVEHGIPRSVYYNETVTIFFPEDSYLYNVVGTDNGTYGLSIDSTDNGTFTTFTTMDVPTSTNATHQYAVDWSNLSQGKEGVTLQIDSDGDGIYEQNTTPSYAVSTAIDPAKNMTSTLITAPANKTISISASNIDTFIELRTNAPVTNGVINVTGYVESPVTELENNLGLYLEINSSNVSIESASIMTYYSNEEVNTSGLNKSTLSFYNFDESSSQWVKLNSTVNTVENYVLVNVSHFSDYAIAGELADTDGDGIVDINDSCPPQPENFNEYQDTDGCPDTPPSGGGGGGGGGGGVSAGVSVSVSSIEAGEAAVFDFSEKMGELMSEIVLFTKQAAYNVKITIESLKAKPYASLPDPAGEVYKYMKITTSNLPATSIDRAEIKFKVNKSWLRENDIDQSTVALNRNVQSRWDILATTRVDSGDTYIYYTAETPGFSHFTITAENGSGYVVETVPIATQAPITALPITTPAPTTPVPTTPVPTTTVPPPEEPEKTGICGPTAVLLLAMLFPVLSRIRRRSR